MSATTSHQPSAEDTVLLTGATGHVGFCTLLHALRAGHTVRCAVRSDAKAAFVQSRPQIQALNLPKARLTFVVVPDITIPCAYNEATEDVKYVIHIASPLVTGDQVPLAQHQEYFIQPAARGTLAMLESAQKSLTVRRVVITSSIVALLPVAQMDGVEPRCNAVLPTDRVEFVPEPYETEFAAYAASKVAALRVAEKWMQDQEKPNFDVIHLHPSFVQGRNDLATTTAEAFKGTNAVVLATLLGKRWGCGYVGATVHVDDVARIHVDALHPSVRGNQSYILSTPSRWDDAKAIAKREFPEAVEKRLILGTGSVGSIDIPFDVSLTERTFGIRFQGFDDQVKSLVGHFLELRAKKITGLGLGVRQGIQRQVRASA